VNLILLQPTELDRPLTRTDRRAQHVLTVLRRRVGDSFDAGLINGPRGKATITSIDQGALTFRFTPTHPPPPDVAAITLIVGLPRPQTARDILREMTTLGVSTIHFVRTEKSEPSYAQSTLWSSGEWERHVLAGAEQAFDTRIPDVTHQQSLDAALGTAGVAGTRLALDNYESAIALGSIAAIVSPCLLAIGGERGWSDAERHTLRQHGCTLAHLGPRVLRTETACVAAVSILRAKLGLM
jgi:16S rRNA (uracil1498-N3)-methyltransferase